MKINLIGHLFQSITQQFAASQHFDRQFRFPHEFLGGL